MERIICVDIPLLPLQILLKHNPQWKSGPTAVVSEDKPLGTVLMMNKKAKDKGIRKGMRYATALTVEPHLVAGVVDDEEIDEHAGEIEKKLLDYSPEVEIAEIEVGVFWLNGEGLSKLLGSEEEILRGIIDGISRLGFSSRCASGFSKHGSFCAARSITVRTRVRASRSHSLRVIRSKREESQIIKSLPLAALPIDGKSYDLFSILSLERAGDMLALTEGSVLKRFGEEVQKLHAFLSGKGLHRIQPEKTEDDAIFERRFLHPSPTVGHLLGRIDPLIERVMENARKNGTSLHSLFFRFSGEDDECFSEAVIPTEPTRDVDVFRRLLAVRLEGKRSFPPVTGIELLPCFVKNGDKQYALAGIESHRNLELGAEAFSLIRADLGNDSVQVARLDPEHMPTRRFHWENVMRLSNPVIDAAPAIADGCSVRSARKGNPSSADDEETYNSNPEKTSEITVCRAIRIENYEKEVCRGRAGEDPGGGVVVGSYIVSGRWWEGEENQLITFIERNDGRIYWIRKGSESGGEELLGWIE